MEKGLSLLKGIHPGIVLERELPKRNLGRGRFSFSCSELSKPIGAIMKGKGDMNTALALRIEEKLGLEEGFFMLLQVKKPFLQPKFLLDPQCKGSIHIPLAFDNGTDRLRKF